MVTPLNAKDKLVGTWYEFIGNEQDLKDQDFIQSYRELNTWVKSIYYNDYAKSKINTGKKARKSNTWLGDFILQTKPCEIWDAFVIRIQPTYLRKTQDNSERWEYLKHEIIKDMIEKGVAKQI